MLKTLAALSVVSLALAGCAHWNKPNTSLQQTAKDLSDCRFKANQGGQKVYSAMELEMPCMTGKGYSLGNTPPQQ